MRPAPSPVPTITVTLEESDGPATWSEVAAARSPTMSPSWDGEWCLVCGPEGILARFRIRPLPGEPEAGP